MDGGRRLLQQRQLSPLHTSVSDWMGGWLPNPSRPPCKGEECVCWQGILSSVQREAAWQTEEGAIPLSPPPKAFNMSNTHMQSVSSARSLECVSLQARSAIQSAWY